MQIIHKDIRKGELKVKVENLDDLWYLSTIIDVGDSMRTKTQRKIKLGDGTDRNVKVITKTIVITITVEKVEFHKYANILRVSGKVQEGTDDIAKGVYHTFNIEENVIFSLRKEKFLAFQVDKLKEASEQKKGNILICVFDRENANFALLKKYGYEMLSEIKGDVMKKDNPEKVTSTFYKDIIKLLKDYETRYQITKIVLGSPAFWKEYLLKELENNPLKKKIIPASCNSVGKNGVAEVLKRQEVLSAIQDDRIIREMQLVEELIAAIATHEKAAYGIKDVSGAVDVGAVQILLVTDALIHKMRENDTFHKLDKLMKLADNMQAEIHIISSEHDAGRQLDGLGGIGAILRYKLN